MVRTDWMAAVVFCALLIIAPGVSMGQATQPAPVAVPAMPGATVAIPWPELAALLDRAGAARAAPPVDVVFAPASYVVKPVGQVAQVAADVELTMLRDGYALVPVAAGGVAVESVTLDGQPASLVLQGQMLAALVSGAGRKAMHIELKRPVATDDGVPRFDLPLADWPISTVKVTVPGAVQITAGNAASAASANADGATTLTATFRGGAVAAVSWRPRLVQAEAAPARVYAQTQTRVSIRRGSMRYQSAVELEVERGAIPNARIAIDPKAVLLSVSGKNIASYAEQADAQGRAVIVTFSRPIEGSQLVDLSFQKDLPEAGGAADVIAARVEGARRDGGTIVIAADATYEVRPAVAAPAAAGNDTSLQRISVSELPESLRSTSATLAYRYTAPTGVAIALTPVKPQPPKITAVTQTRVAVDREVIRCQAGVTYEIHHAGVDSFRIALPKDVELVSVEGEGIRDRQVIDENNGRILLVGLKDVARKHYAMTIVYDVRFAEKPQAAAGAATQPAGTKPQKPTTAGSQDGAAGGGAAGATADVSVPLIGHPDAAQSRGYVGIEVGGGYELSSTAQGAERIDVKELPQALWSTARSPMIQAWRYDDGVPSLSLAVTRHQDLDVLVAMSDVCEAATTITADGRSVTKLMYVVRNNLKPHLTLQLPPGAQV